MKQPQNVFITTEQSCSTQEIDKSLLELLTICPASSLVSSRHYYHHPGLVLTCSSWGEEGALFTDVCTDWEAAA